MRKVQIVGAPERTRVEILVAREGEPGGEVRRVEPGVAENASVTGLDKQSGVAERSYLQLNLPSDIPILVLQTRRFYQREGVALRPRGGALWGVFLGAHGDALEKSQGDHADHQVAAPVAYERQRDTGHRHQTHRHANVHEDVEEEDRGDADGDEDAEAVSGDGREVEHAPD